jgi:hypothetical protein
VAADDGVRLLALIVLHGDGRAQADVARRGAFDLDSIAQEHGQVLDPPFEDRLLLARRFVFGVLPEVAEFTGGGDSGDDDRPLYAGELLELGADADDAARGEVDGAAHDRGCLRMSREEGQWARQSDRWRATCLRSP